MTTARDIIRRVGEPAEGWVQRGFLPPITLAERIETGVLTGGSTRLVFAGATGRRELTTGQLFRQARVLAAGMSERGLSRGDCVAVQLPPTMEHAVVLIACILCGLVYIPIGNSYGIAETRFILERAAAKALFLPVRFHKTSYADRPSSLADVDALETIVFCGEGDVPAGGIAWTSLQDAAFEGSVQPGNPDDITAIIFTSGTTSEPKGVLHSDASLHAYCEVAAHYAPPRRDSFNLCALPGIGGLCYMLRPFLYGEGAIFLDQWNGGLAADLVRDYRPWWTGGAPFFLRSILGASAPEDRQSLVFCLIGGANVPPALIEHADALGIRAVRAYGSSEHPVGACGLVADTVAERALTDGAPMPGTQFRIVDDGEICLPDGEPGEIVSRGPQMFGGYLDATLNAGAFTADGWFKTGDIGIIRDGRLTVVDRKKDMIIRGGQNISSKEIEDILCGHPDVLEAAAIGWPDPVYGERVGVFVKTTDGRAIELAEVSRHFAEAGVAKYKTPERLCVIGEFQRNASGKILKNLLRDMVRARTEADSR